MNIVFLCGSLEPARDGVGDYLRNLAARLIEKGHSVLLVAINDRHIAKTIKEVQVLLSFDIQVWRIASLESDRVRYSIVQQAISATKCDWVSLQFVPYAFDEKGVPFKLPANLAALSGDFRWHIMYHELWVGVDGRLTLKNNIVKLFQKYIIANLNSKIQPAFITTSIPIYLQKIGASNKMLLPLFGNIPVLHVKEEQLKVYDILYVVHFGSFTGFIKELEDQFVYIKALAASNNRNVQFNVIGSCGPFKEQSLNLAAKVFGEQSVHFLGKLPATSISEYMHRADIAISRATHLLYGKSGSTIALLEHGLPVVLRGAAPLKKILDLDPFYKNGQILFTNLSQNTIPTKKAPVYNGAEKIADLFINYLNEANKA